MPKYYKHAVVLCEGLNCRSSYVVVNSYICSLCLFVYVHMYFIICTCMQPSHRVQWLLPKIARTAIVHATIYIFNWFDVLAILLSLMIWLLLLLCRWTITGALECTANWAWWSLVANNLIFFMLSFCLKKWWTWMSIEYPLMLKFRVFYNFEVRYMAKHKGVRVLCWSVYQGSSSGFFVFWSHWDAASRCLSNQLAGIEYLTPCEFIDVLCGKFAIWLFVQIL